MANPYFSFKQFSIHQDRSAMKVSTDACLFGAWVAGILQKEQATGNLLDIGTGTGLLSLMLAQKIPGISIDAVELDKEAAQQAAANVAASPYAGQVNVVEADIRTCHLPPTYDTIISNPPFYEGDLKSTDRVRNIAHHDEGLLLEELLDLIRHKLSDKGRFYLLWPFKRKEDILQGLSKKNLHLTRMMTVKQTVQHNPFRLMLEGRIAAKGAMEPECSEMAIRDDADQYTTVFTELLKDYYLYL
jgi:tRNA1Val (adenine37-N6)-methyltransferase